MIKQIMDKYITFDKYQNKDIRYSSVVTKQLRDQKYRTYHRIPLFYNFGSDDKEIINDFLFECCEMESNFGIMSKTFDNGFVQYKIPCQFNTSIPDQTKCLNCFKNIYQTTSNILNSSKSYFNNFSYQSPIYGDLENNINLNLYYRGQGVFYEQTLFTDPKGNTIPWNLLINVKMRFIPLLRIKYLHIIEGSVSLEMEIISAIITKI